MTPEKKQSVVCVFKFGFSYQLEKAFLYQTVIMNTCGQDQRWEKEAYVHFVFFEMLPIPARWHQDAIIFCCTVLRQVWYPPDYLGQERCAPQATHHTNPKNHTLLRFLLDHPFEPPWDFPRAVRLPWDIFAKGLLTLVLWRIYEVGNLLVKKNTHLFLPRSLRLWKTIPNNEEYPVV